MIKTLCNKQMASNIDWFIGLHAHIDYNPHVHGIPLEHPLITIHQFQTLMYYDDMFKYDDVFFCLYSRGVSLLNKKQQRKVKFLRMFWKTVNMVIR